MAIMTLLLVSNANEEIDVLRVLSMLLIHDLVEIDAGDTYAYDEEGKQTQRVREVKGSRRDLRNPTGRSGGKSFVNFGKNSRRQRRRKLSSRNVMDNVSAGDAE